MLFPKSQIRNKQNQAHDYQIIGDRNIGVCLVFGFLVIGVCDDTLGGIDRADQRRKINSF